MPALQTFLGALNTAFSRENIAVTALNRSAFVPGQNLDAAVDAVIGDSPINSYLKAYLGTVPPSVVNALLAVADQALGREKPTSIVFAWSPAYDFELSIWEAPDTTSTRGGIAIALKGRYPDDPHPLAC